MPPANLLAALPAERTREVSETLLEAPGLRLERIVSRGQATPAGQWYDAPAAEWVLLLSGSAGVRFADEALTRTLRPGDPMLIPAHCRHRVEWSSSDPPAIWLALHHG